MLRKGRFVKHEADTVRSLDYRLSESSNWTPSVFCKVVRMPPHSASTRARGPSVCPGSVPLAWHPFAPFGCDHQCLTFDFGSRVSQDFRIWPVLPLFRDSSDHRGVTLAVRCDQGSGDSRQDVSMSDSGGRGRFARRRAPTPVAFRRRLHH